MSGERTGWRDEWISTRHRTWGKDVPVVDLDCIVCDTHEEVGDEGWNVMEYDRCRPRAIVEYKRYGTSTIDLGTANNRALRNLADMAGLPFILVAYDPEYVKFVVIPGNEHASRFVPEKKVFTEMEYVELMYRLRDRPYPGFLAGVRTFF